VQKRTPEQVNFNKTQTFKKKRDRRNSQPATKMLKSY
jgi:hypothetical protein